MNRSRVWALLTVLGLASGVAVGCGSDERFGAAAPAAGGAGGAPGGAAGSAGAGASAGTSAGGAGGSGEVRRSVGYRNPYGNVEASDNLLWDGDFEWHTPFGSQYGWVTPSIFGRYQPTTLEDIAVGPQCRSGLKCAELTSRKTILGVAVSPTGSSVQASVWAKPASGDCAEVEVSLIGCFDGGDSDLSLAAQPIDSSGWCRYEVLAPERQRATCLMVSSRHFDQSITLVDDAVVLAAPAGAKLVGAPQAASARVKAELPALRKALREWVVPGAKPPTLQQRRIEAWLSRRKLAAGSDRRDVGRGQR